MPEYNNIRNIINKLYNSLKDLIKNNGIFSFINLAALNFTIMILIILITEWINSNMNIFNFSIPMISLRLALSSLFIGIWIGFFKITLNYLDGNKINILNLTSNFDLLPRILVLKLISYFTTLPLFSYIFYKFPYDLQVYGTNIELFISDTSNNIIETYSDTVAWEIFSNYISSSEILLFIFLSLLPVWFSLRFWCAEFLIIDQNLTIRESLFTSYKLTKNVFELLAIGFILMILNLFCMLFGFVFLIVGLTTTYLIILIYYRHLKSFILIRDLNK